MPTSEKKFIDFKYLIPILIFAFFAVFSIVLPCYNGINGLYNKLLSTYKITWVDGRSPISFTLIKQLINTGNAEFSKNAIIDGRPIQLNYDIVQKGDKGYYAHFAVLPHYIFSVILKPFSFLSDLNLYKTMLTLNIIFSGLTLSIFYLIQLNLGLKPRFAVSSSILAGIATSVLIFSKYLFIADTLITFFFVLFFYFLLKTKNSNTVLNKSFLFITFLLFLLFTWKISLSIVFFIPLAFLIYKLRIYKNILPLILVFLIISSVMAYFTINYVEISEKDKPSASYDQYMLLDIPIFSEYGSYIPAIDYMIYGYHNATSTYKLTRAYSYFYTFAAEKGNAIFASTYNIFGSLFSEKGFIYNSPFLIFSLFGVWIYKKNDEKKLLICTILLFLVVCGVLNNEWFGGVTPRYVRSFGVPILFLTFFSFYYIQENSKNKLLLVVFSIFAILSILNVASLSIREDWTYEHPADLVSYDLVLWPYLPVNTTAPMNADLLQFYLISRSEQMRWTFGGEGICNAVYEDGIKTDPCDCKLGSWADRTINIPWKTVRINVTACAGIAGNDGTEGLIFLNKNPLDAIFINSYNCSSKSYVQTITPGDIAIRLKSGSYGNCSGDMTFWKYLSIEKYGE